MLRKFLEERIIFIKEFEDVKREITLECPILLKEDALPYIESYKRKFKKFPPHELDDLKL